MICAEMIIKFSLKYKFKMISPTNLECNSIETITLNKQTNYRLMEIGKIKDYFDQEIKYQQACLNK